MSTLREDGFSGITTVSSLAVSGGDRVAEKRTTPSFDESGQSAVMRSFPGVYRPQVSSHRGALEVAIELPTTRS